MGERKCPGDSATDANIICVHNREKNGKKRKMLQGLKIPTKGGEREKGNTDGLWGEEKTGF